MENVLSDIRAVPGVTGAMVLAKGSPEHYQMLPASFTSRSIETVKEKLQHLSRRLPPHSRLNLKFENGVGLVYNLERSVVLIFGRSDMDVSCLGLVLKSALQSIERKLEEQRPKLQPTEKLETLAIDKNGLNLIIEAINLVAEGYVKDKGVFWVTKNLRKTKDDMIREFPVISGFYVNNDGKVSLLKTPQEKFDRKTPLALIKWIDLFVNHIPRPPQHDRVGDIRKLTTSISAPLEGIGFYDLYSKVARKLV